MRNGAAEYHMNQYTIARLRYVRGVNQLKELERAAYAVGGTDYSRPRTTGGSTRRQAAFADRLDKIIDLRAELLAAANDLKRQRAQITTWIRQLDDSRLRYVMREYYLNGHGVSTIAARTGVSDRRIEELLSRGAAALEQIICQTTD